MRTSLVKSAPNAIIARLNGSSRIDAFEAAKQVWNIDGSALAKPLIKVLRTGRRAFNRAAVAYAMQAASRSSVINTLERAVRKEAENPDVRGHGAETLAHCHRKSTHRLSLHQASPRLTRRSRNYTICRFHHNEARGRRCEIRKRCSRRTWAWARSIRAGANVP